MRAYVPLPSTLILCKGVPLRQPSDEHAPLTLLSDSLPQRVNIHLQPSAVNSPPLPQFSALPLHLDATTLQPSDVCATPPSKLSILLQLRGKLPLLSSTIHAYVTLMSALLPRKVMYIRQPSAECDHIPHLSA